MFALKSRRKEKVAVELPGLLSSLQVSRQFGVVVTIRKKNQQMYLDWDTLNQGGLGDFVGSDKTHVTLSGATDDNNDKLYASAVVYYIIGNTISPSVVLTPPTRISGHVIYKPYLISGLGLGASFGQPAAIGPTNHLGADVFSVNLRKFTSLKQITMTFTRHTAISSEWPKSIKRIYMRGNSLLTSIKPFPTSLKELILDFNDSEGILPLGLPIQNCSELENLTIGRLGGSPAGFAYVKPQNLPAIDLSFASNLKILVIISASLAGISLPSNLSQLKQFVLYKCSQAATLTQSIIDTLLATASGLEYFCVGTSLANWSRSIGNSDISSSLIIFMIRSTNIFGNISITNIKPLLQFISVGNTHDNIDITGLTGATALQIDSCNTQYLTLPTNSVITVLNLNGNKLSVTTNPNLWSQIEGYANSLISLTLSNQNSMDAFGTHINLSMFISLTSFNGVNIKASQITLRSSITSINLISVDNNPSLSVINNLYIQSNITYLSFTNTILNVDFTQLPKIQNAYGALNVAQTTVDLRTNTNTAGKEFIFNNCPNLTAVYFHANSVYNVTTRAIQFSSCNISVFENEEQIVTSNTVQINSNSINKILKFGDNSFLPNVIYVQNNGMSQVNVNGTIDKMYDNRAKWPTTTKTLNIAGTNAAPSGIYQPPAGFVQGSNDGTPVSVKEKLYVLAKNYNWILTFN